MKRILSIFFLITFVFICLTNCEQKQETTKIKKIIKNIYDENADAHKDIETALITAKTENKNVLLMFGGNWCSWCHLLHQTFHENETVKKYLSENFVLVMVDVGKKDKNLDLNEKYKNPFQLGFPVIVILNQEGNHIHTQETGSLEYTKEESDKKGHNPDRLLNFLKQWSSEK